MCCCVVAAQPYVFKHDNKVIKGRTTKLYRAPATGNGTDVGLVYTYEVRTVSHQRHQQACSHVSHVCNTAMLLVTACFVVFLSITTL